MMNWTGNFFFGAATMGVTGSIGCLLFVALRKWLISKRPELGLYLVKTVLMLFLIPFIYVGLRMSRLVYNGGNLIFVGIFGIGSSPDMVKAVESLGVLWLIGLAVGICIRMKHYIQLKKMLKKNVPVTEDYWYVLQDEACKTYNFDKVLICQNAEVHTPFVINSVRAVIVLPFLEYTEQQMHMVMDHELNHIRGKDLLWRKIALVVSWLHWYNPFVYLLIKWLNQEQEIRCDIDSCQNTEYYTAKDYFGFMISLTDGIRNNIFVAALFESSDMTMRRLEAFESRKKYGKLDRKLLLLCVLGFVFVSSIPAYAMSEQAARLEEQWLEGGEVLIKEETGTPRMQQEQVMYADETEMDMLMLTEEEIFDCFSFCFQPEMRYLTPERMLEAGDEIWATVACEDVSVSFLAGLKNVETGETRYVEGMDWIMQQFEINEAGTYRIVIINQSDAEAKIDGNILYVRQANNYTDSE